MSTSMAAFSCGLTARSDHDGDVGEYNVNVIRALRGRPVASQARQETFRWRATSSCHRNLPWTRGRPVLSSTNLQPTSMQTLAWKPLKAIRRTMEANEKSAFVIDHDVYFIDIVSDSLARLSKARVDAHGKAQGPFRLREGMNRFLEGVNVTFRRDHDSKRPRINKT